MEYIYITGKKGSEWPEEFETLEEAEKFATYEFNYMTEADKEALEYAYILKSVNPDTEAPNHYDGDIIKIYKEGE